MSHQLLGRLGIALAILIVAWIGVEVLRAGPGDGMADFPVDSVAAGDVDSVRIERPDGIVVLRRTADSAWTVNGFRADGAAVTDFFGALEEGFQARLVGRNAATHGRFEVDAASARRVQVFDGEAAAVDLVVGKRGPSFRNVYLRLPDEDEVYLVRSRVATFVDRRQDDWRDKAILAVEPDGVAALTVARAGREYTLERADGTWRLNGGPADSAAAARLVSQFQALNALGFPSDAQRDSVDFDAPDRRVLLRDADARTVAALVFDSTATGYWVRREGDDTIYRLDRFKVDQLTPADSTLRPAPGSS